MQRRGRRNKYFIIKVHCYLKKRFRQRFDRLQQFIWSPKTWRRGVLWLCSVLSQLFAFLSPQVLIVCSTGLAGIMLLNYQRDYTVWVLPLIIVCLFAFLVAHCFLSIYEMVVDVLFLCFAIDTKYNDGSPGKEFYMDKVLMVSLLLYSCTRLSWRNH